MGKISLKQALVNALNSGLGIKAGGAVPIEYIDTVWDDLLGPLQGASMDVASGRLDYNYFNGGIGFQNNARYPEEPVSLRSQIYHKYKEGTDGHPHMHWLQQSANIPNWLLAWKLTRNGQPGLVEIDFSNYNFEVIDSHAFAYTAGVLNQISKFPSIDLSLAKISDLLHLVLFRDTSNVSTLFAGADPSAVTEIATDLDTHIEINTPGSSQEYIK